jgi:catechol 2,3-dioxygenase-like lactoylglutathione lyase family enzyme
MSAPRRVSHIAVVTGDLDGFRTFYEDTIGLRTTIVFGGGPGHSRQAILMAGDDMLHVFEVSVDRTTTHQPSTGLRRGRDSSSVALFGEPAYTPEQIAAAKDGTLAPPITPTSTILSLSEPATSPPPPTISSSG